ncbi:DUF4760 domain-containing protein [Actinoplanes subtropicus]|uniref:DUF4760 domain-containing protein n=1 Tax=Actinoplanes subtropicus TaxID=543632 RepID=UPI00068FBFB7|nr:hypothetical protein [Actinoplanes subtropicus]
MADGQTLGVAALVVSLLALVISAVFAARQVVLMRNANYVPVLIDLLSQFRSMEFNDNYRFICTRLPVEHDSVGGITGLPDDVREKIYDVAYYYQVFAALTALGVLQDQHIIVVLRDRIIHVWEAIEPFVLVERESAHHTGPFLFRNLEEFAKKAKEMPSTTVDRFMRGLPMKGRRQIIAPRPRRK